MLKITNLQAAVDGRKVIKGVSLTIKPGQIHVLMGPNGSGKTSLAYALMGHPNYKSQKSCLAGRQAKVKSQVKLDGKDIEKLKPDERARLGLFLAFQNPLTIAGVTVANLLRTATSTLSSKRQIGLLEFREMLEGKCQDLGITKEFLERSLNDGFSGGEKKKIEMLQLTFLRPKYAIIDEIDTGLDIDALKVVAKGVKKLVASGSGILLITHYQRILKYLKPDFVHLMIEGKIVKSGGYRLADLIEEKGYRKLLKVL